MRKGNDRTDEFSSGATQNLVLRIGVCLALVLNSVEASPASTAGISGARHHTASSLLVAVNSNAGLVLPMETNIGTNSLASQPALGEAVVDAAALLAGMGPEATRGDTAGLAPWRPHGLASIAKFRLVGSYDSVDTPHVNRIVAAILAHVHDDAPLTAMRLLTSGDAPAYLDPDDMSALKLRIAAGLVTHGQSREAHGLMDEVMKDGGPVAVAGESQWIAGLAAYGVGKFDRAQSHFTAAAKLEDDPWGLSAAAFWAGRSAARVEDRETARHWLGLAAAQKGTLYGMLAARLLDASAPVAIAATNLSAAYPLPRWKPKDGFALDQALVCAIIRQESQFNPAAESNAGAIGLMQIMPQTATHVTGKRANWNQLLHDPLTNLDIGQRYLCQLLDSEDVGDNLVLMAVAYNGGPTALAHWRHSNHQEDPLLFMETWPVGETRGFTEQVLTNYWTYRVRLGRDTASLSDLAHGRWPLESPAKEDPAKPATPVLEAGSQVRDRGTLVASLP